jgi:hypothetical protein
MKKSRYSRFTQSIRYWANDLEIRRPTYLQKMTPPFYNSTKIHILKLFWLKQSNFGPYRNYVCWLIFLNLLTTYVAFWLFKLVLLCVGTVEKNTNLTSSTCLFFCFRHLSSFFLSAVLTASHQHTLLNPPPTLKTIFQFFSFVLSV